MSMNIWILTIGNSDVQLKTEQNWERLCTRFRSHLGTEKKFSLPVSEKKYKDAEHVVRRYLTKARAIGIVYGKAIAEHYEDLDFPLLDSFVTMLGQKNIALDRIIVLLTDQTAQFTLPERRQLFCPYWQDTCTLEPILQEYFSRYRSTCLESSSKTAANFSLEFLQLQPQGDHGLDHWNSVLELVQKLFGELKDIPQDANVYVSHQAGTPAISSAVQFASLAQFGEQVQFLANNEYDNQSEFIASSNYLRRIRIQEAKALLDRYDYGGTRNILGLTNAKPSSTDEQQIKKLLDAAVQWNLAKFDKFAGKLGDRGTAYKQKWYWTGYEAAYLAVVRMNQKATVDSLLHSFRAVEGIVCEWAHASYGSHIRNDEIFGPQIQVSILNVEDRYLKDKPDMLQRLKNTGELDLHSTALFKLLQAARPEWRQNKDIAVVWRSARGTRNDQAHRLKGLTSREVFKAWDSTDQQTWSDRILGCLNFISKQNFKSIEEASLMAQIHQELVELIDRL